MGEVVAFIWASLATLGVLAAAYVRWRAGGHTEAVTLWRDEAAAWRAKAERQDAAIAELTRRVDHLETENRVLRTLHDSRAEMVALRDTVERKLTELTAMLAHDGR